MAPAAMPCGPRVRHALRSGVGGCLLAWLAQTRATTGCISLLLFYIGTIAGTPEYLQGFVLRSAANTFYGSLIGSGLAAAVLSIADTSRTAAFFLFLPPASFLAAMRTDPAIVPLPLVALVFSGFMILPAVDSPPEEGRAAALTFALDAALAFLASIVTQLLFPDLAAAEGDRTLATQARAAGGALSSAATRMFSEAPATDAASVTAISHSSVGEAQEHADWERVTPPGLRRVGNYAAMARARVLLAAADYEPLLPGLRRLRSAPPKPGTPAVLNEMEVLINKVASLESAAFVAHRRAPGAHFSRQYLVMMLGEPQLPLYIKHFAACAAACQELGTRFGTAAESAGAAAALPGLDVQLDARSGAWKKRREAMYCGLKTQFQLYWRKRAARQGAASARPDTSLEEVLEVAEDAEDDGGRGDESASATATNSHAPAVVRGSEIRSIIFMAVTSHALSMSLGDLQQSVLAAREESWDVLAPFRMFWLPLPPAGRRAWTVLRLQLKPWELRFVATHVLLLGTIMGVLLFVGVLEEHFEMPQLSWVYASAALCAQLSVETTVFIGVLRVVATLAGCAAAFGVTRVIKALGSRAAEFALGPYFAVISVAALLIVPPKFRYAAFLFIATNELVIFCPHGQDACVAAGTTLDESCFPDVRYAVARATNVSIGVILAVGFHTLLWPRFAQDSARRCLAQVYDGATDLFAAVHRKYRELGDKAKLLEQTGSSGNLGCSGSVADFSNSTLHDRDARPGGRLSGEYRLQMDESSLVGGELIKGVGLDELNACTRHLVSEPLQRALILLKADASVWAKGRLSLPEALRELPEHFVSLSVAITEMASILGRRPVLSGHYESTAHDTFIAPLAYEHETLLVSLFHLGKTIQELLRAQDSPRALPSLQCAIRHVRQTLRLIHNRVSSLRRAIHNQHPSAPPGARISGVTATVAASALPDRSSSSGESGGNPKVFGRADSQDAESMHVDDIVLYNAFSFASNACAAAFLSIADLCEANIRDLLRSRSLRIRTKTK